MPLFSDDLSTLIKNGGVTNISYSISSKTYHLLRDIKWNNWGGSGSTGNYITLADGEIFDGHNHYIDFGKVPEGSTLSIYDERQPSNGFISIVGATLNYPIIKNLKVKSCVVNGGGIVMNGSANFIVDHCKHKGNIVSGGGIVGNTCYNFSVMYSKSKGDIVGIDSGGIVGSGCGGYGDYNNFTNNTVTIKNCKYKGKIISSNSGGIAGKNFGFINKTYNGTVDFSVLNTLNINTCKIDSDVYANDCGGVCGINPLKFVVGNAHTNNFNVTNNLNVTNCLYTGTVSADNFGGILGENLHSTSTTGSGITLYSAVNISNCVTSFDKYGLTNGGILTYGCYSARNFAINISDSISFGNILNEFCAGFVCYGNNNVTIENCYASGLLNDVIHNAGIIGGSTGQTFTAEAINCYFTTNGLNLTRPIYAVDNAGATAINCFANNPNGQGQDISLLVGGLGNITHTLPPSDWLGVKDSYPILKLNKCFSKYNKYNEVPKLNYK